MDNFRTPAILATTVMLSACGVGSITSKPVTTADAVVKGPIYHLPATSLSFTLAFKLDECSPQAKIILERVTFNPPTVIADQSAAATFRIDPDDLTNWMKALESAKLELVGGMVKSVNYRAKDKTQETVASLASFLTKVPLLFGVFVAAGGGPSCTPGAQNLTTSRDALRGHLTKLGSMRDGLVGGATTLSKDEIAALSASYKSISELMAHVSTELAAVEKAMVVEHTVTLVPEPSDEMVQELVLPVSDTWFSQWASPAPIGNVMVKLEPVGTQSLPFATSCSDCGAAAGIYYRDPALTKITIKLASRSSPLGTETFPVFQLGRIGFIPITNGIFESSAISVEQASNGYLTTIEYKSEEARAQALFGTLDSAAGTVNNAKVQQMKGQMTNIDAERELIESEEKLIRARINKEAAEREASSK